MLALNETNFEHETGSGLVLVDFFAPWCGPCRVMAPELESLTNVKVCKVDTDESPDLAGRFRISSIPCLIFFKESKEVARMVGLQSRQKVQDKVDELTMSCKAQPD